MNEMEEGELELELLQALSARVEGLQTVVDAQQEQIEELAAMLMLERAGRVELAEAVARIALAVHATPTSGPREPPLLPAHELLGSNPFNSAVEIVHFPAWEDAMAEVPLPLKRGGEEGGTEDQHNEEGEGADYSKGEEGDGEEEEDDDEICIDFLSTMGGDNDFGIDLRAIQKANLVTPAGKGALRQRAAPEEKTEEEMREAAEAEAFFTDGSAIRSLKTPLRLQSQPVRSALVHAQTSVESREEIAHVRWADDGQRESLGDGGGTSNTQVNGIGFPDSPGLTPVRSVSQGYYVTPHSGKSLLQQIKSPGISPIVEMAPANSNCSTDSARSISGGGAGNFDENSDQCVKSLFLDKEKHMTDEQQRVADAPVPSHPGALFIDDRLQRFLYLGPKGRSDTITDRDFAGSVGSHHSRVTPSRKGSTSVPCSPPPGGGGIPSFIDPLGQLGRQDDSILSSVAASPSPNVRPMSHSGGAQQVSLGGTGTSFFEAAGMVAGHQRSTSTYWRDRLSRSSAGSR
jgi:hypothetical protein